MKRRCFALALVFSAWSVSATPQAGDTLVVEATGKTITVYRMQLPKKVVDAIDKIEKPTSSANWRGFLVNMKLEKKELYITSVTVLAGDLSQRTVSLKKLFGNEGPIKAVWYTGKLAEYVGESMGYTHAKKTVRLHHFEKGKYIKTETMDTLDFHRGNTGKKEANKKAEPSAQP